jgi:hypothetical protein
MTPPLDLFLPLYNSCNTTGNQDGKVLALSDDYTPPVASDDTRIRRNPAIPKVALSDVNKEVILDYVTRTNQLWVNT